MVEAGLLRSAAKALPFYWKRDVAWYRPGGVSPALTIIVALELLIGLASIMFPPLVIPGLFVGLFIFLIFLRRPEYSYYAFVFLLPFWNISILQVGWIDVRPADLAVVTMVIIYVTNLALRKEIHFEPTVLGLPIIVFALWAILSLSWGSFSAGAVPLVHFGYGLAIYFMTVNLVRDMKSLRTATAIWIIAGMISALIACYEFTLAPTESFTRFGQIRSSAYFVGKNRLGNFLMICILLTLGRVIIARAGSMRFMLIAAMGVMLTGLLTTLSRTAFAGLAVGTVYCAIYSKRLRKLLAFSLLAFVAIALLVTKGNVIILFFERFFSIFAGFSEMSAKRVASWRDALEMFFVSPVVGIGFGEYTRVITAASPEVYLLKVHNVYLAVLSELGMVGFLIFMGMLTSIFAFVRKTLRLVKQDYRSYQLCLSAAAGLIGYLLCTLSQAIYVQERGTWSFLGLGMAILMICRNSIVSNNGKIAGRSNNDKPDKN